MVALLYGAYFDIRPTNALEIRDTVVAREIYLFLLDLGELVDILVRIDSAGPVVDDNRRDE
ncbi:hypothetical protein [Methanoregula sp.]|uniref:hypothetical protein n=1 Tax=Methanoregula sp. TaxID=2052170 RepID=UPI000CC80119|nr:hypothetical protein [Methanoregula sp.]PKG32185.1 MAG: hypothetical protein CW742_09445 [Methanoregula sp.]